jgi:cell division transport system ATP-binding protein
MKGLKSLVEFDGVDIYNHDKVVLGKVDFSIYQGEFCYVIGKTGSGKSSFLKALYAANKIKGGKAMVLGQDLHEMNVEGTPYYRRKLGMVFQEIYLFEEMTVWENLDFVLRATDWHDKDERSQRIKEVLSQLNMMDSRDIRVSNMSGGEQQTIAIGRAMLNKPQLIIADEPTGNLDPETSEKVLLMLRDLAIEYQASVILSTHDVDLIRKFPSRFYKCDDAKMIEQ